ncbi:signal transduction histidine kinase, glucose-6-phosphate specific [Methylophilaceae bacterium 11]|nr:signal transduction histidine kinase, glucose-6-phosphate specific [Methylophilaceae bacterium 11]
MSLQLKLNLMITGLLLSLLALSFYSITHNAREDVRAEIESTSNLVLHLLDAEIIHYSSDFGWLSPGAEGQTSIFRLKNLGNIRHLRIDFYDASGRLRETNKNAYDKTDINQPPQWFVKAMDLSTLSVSQTRKNIVLNGRFLGELVVTPDPSFEIAEVWDDTVGLLTLVAIFFVLMNLFAYIAVKYTFKPVKQIISALTQLETGNFQSRLPEFKQVELKEIGSKFNLMADTLQQSTVNNHRLTQQIINLQEDERKRLAQDIHDEIGQYLTAIHVDASAIFAAKTLVTAKESAKAIGAVTRQMMNTIHDLLQRLRPRVLDELGLSLALAELAHHWRERNSNTLLIHNIANITGCVEETTAVTAYRVMQECLTNVSKHANARKLNIEIKHDEKHVFMEFEDDGNGFDFNQHTKGYGLAGMMERVQGLRGTMHIDSVVGRGTKIGVILPKKSFNSDDKGL